MQILVVDDESEMAALIARGLTAEGHDVVEAHDGIVAISAASSTRFDLAVVDVTMPGMSGFELSRRLKTIDPTIAVILLTARDAVDDRVRGLDAGADDYMVKPVRRLELLARVDSLLRRARPKQSETEPISIGPYVINLVDRVVTLKEQRIEMTDKEYDLTVFLFRNIGKLISRGHITESVWGRSSDVQSRTVDTHVSRVRKKLELGPANGVRLTPVYNFGYRLEKVSLPDEPPAST